MRRVFEEVASLDRKCYDRYCLSEDLLMEHAAMALYREIPPSASRVTILAGPGNNGGDGIALARMLVGAHEVSLVLPYGAKSAMARRQLERAEAVGIHPVQTPKEADVIVDALFGTGLKRPLDERTLALIVWANISTARKIACDIPTGVGASGAVAQDAFVADVTVTMGAYKHALFGDMAKDYVGEIRVADLGVDGSLYEGETPLYLLEREDMRLPFREKKSAHKGDFGHLAVIAGRKKGAAVMAGRSAFAFGAGLVTVVENEPYMIPYELMSCSSLPSGATAICIGMGLGNQYDDEYLSKFLLGHRLPMVLDADLFGCSILTEVLDAASPLVLTPHPKEFSRLLGITGLAYVGADEIQRDRFTYARLFARRYPGVVLLLKGANTLICHGEELYINPYGTNTLSKGGSGDILTGMIGALLAQGYAPLDAAITASLAHAYASASFDKNNYAMTPQDLIEGIGCL